MAKGFFITLEGGEGAGKSTQAKRLFENLIDNGYEVVTTREPGGSPNAEEIRNLLVNGAPDRWSPVAETLLNYAARQSHLNEKIRPALAQGKVVICDRFMDSTQAYQGAAGGVGQSLLKMLEQEIINGTMPDLTLVFDLDPLAGLQRTQDRQQQGEDRFENKPLSFHKTLRNAFLKIVETEPDRCVLIDAEQEIEEVFNQIWAIVKPRLGQR